jgi:fatty-acyl-CoA synthase
VRVFGPSEEKEGILGFDEVIGRYNGTHLDSGRRIQPQDRASLYHTGGTTGTPKLAPHTHFNEVAMAFMMDAACDLKTGEAILCGLPLFHVNGATVTGSFPFSIGAHVVLISPRGYRDPSAIRYFYKIVDHYKAVSFSSVPTVLSTLLEIPLEGADISSLRYGICGAAPLSTELFTRFETHSGMKILEGYGLTEGTCASSLNPLFGERRVGSIGMRLPYQQMKVMVPEEGGWREAAADEIGAICIKGPNVFAGYLEEARNADLWPEEGWLNSGDLGRRDQDGYFWLTGRTKELIIRGGHNIDPAMIEDPLYRLPEVQVAAAVGRPDAHAGEVPVAYVQLAAGARTTGAELLEYLTRTVGERAAVPKSVEIVDVIPLTPVGKIFKPALRWQAIRKVYLEELAALGATARRVEVQVGEDKKHGALARIRIEADPDADRHQLADTVKALLARYTVRYELEIVSPAAGPENR